MDIFMKFYLYHVVNPDEVVEGSQKPRIIEKGPYSYKEHRVKVNISNSDGTEEGINDDDYTFIKFGQKKSYSFDKATSCDSCNKDDNVTVINAPMVGFQYIFRHVSHI